MAYVSFITAMTTVVNGFCAKTSGRLGFRGDIIQASRRTKVAKNSNGFTVNERIQHEDYGPGTITNIGPLHTTIEFDQAGTKKFMNSLVRLERTDVAAPQRRARSSAAGKSAAKKKAAK
jgi:hypothetical protein